MDLFWQLLVNGIIAGSGWALVALGFALIFAVCQTFHLAHGAVYVAAGYLMYLFKVELALDPVISFLCTLIFATLLGMGMELLVYRPMRRVKASPMIMLISSVGMLIFISNLVALIWTSQVKSLTAGEVRVGYLLGGVAFSPLHVIMVLTALVLFATLQIFLKTTRTGRAMGAVANNPMMAEVVGIDVERIMLITMALGSALAVPAGVLATLDIGARPEMGLYAILMATIAVKVGGIGSIPGAGFGGVFIGIAANLGVWKIPSKWQDAIAFGILLLFIVFRPTGFFGQKLYKADLCSWRC